MKIKELLISWDTMVSIAVAVILLLTLSDDIDINFSKDAFGIGITVLVTVFPMFFAALAIITSFSDNEFIRFLEEQDGTYSALIDHFKFSLTALFAALILSLCLYLHVSYHFSIPGYTYPKQIIVFYFFFFTYAMFAALLTSRDATTYMKFRAKYLGMNNRGQSHND